MRTRTKWAPTANPEVVAVGGEHVAWAHVQLGEVGERRVIRVTGVRSERRTLGADRIAERVLASMRFASVLHVDHADDWTCSAVWTGTRVAWRIAELDRRSAENGERWLRLLRARREADVSAGRAHPADVERVLVLVAALDARGELGTMPVGVKEHGVVLVADDATTPAQPLAPGLWGDP